MTAELPSAKLVRPEPKEPIPDLVTDALSVGDWLSPSHILLEGIELVFGFNPGEEMAKVFAGDWEELSTAGAALRHLGEYAEALGADVDREATAMLLHWRGRAADAASDYFDGLDKAISAAKNPLTGMANDYQTLAAGMQQTAKAIGSLLEQIMDRVIGAALKWAAAAATSPTGAGAVAFAAWAAYDAWKAATLWVQALKWHGYAVTAAQAFAGAAAGYLGALDKLGATPLPAGAYDHEQVG